jgi:hypothetical protein
MNLTLEKYLSSYLKYLRYVFVIMYSLLHQALTAQNFPLKGNERWAYLERYSGNISNPVSTEFYSFFELGNKKIQSDTSWYDVMSFGINIYNKQGDPSSDTLFVDKKLEGHLAVIGNVWLFKKKDSSKVISIFDFDKDVGSAFFVNAFCNVEKIETLYERKKWAMQTDFISIKTEVIEGIGFRYSNFFEPKCMQCSSSDCFNQKKLLCFFQNDTMLNFYDCNLANEMYDLFEKRITTSIDHKKDQIQIYPYTFINELYVNNFDGKIIIQDLSGKQVFKAYVHNGERIPIDITATGIYIYNLVKNNIVVKAGKLIKI